MERGCFITVEGIDGAGKSSHIEFMQSLLVEHGHEVVLTREPGGTNLGERIRDLLLHAEPMHCNTELLLMFASRQELISKVIEPSLSMGKWVISDRFTDASRAYQGGGRGIERDRIEKLIAMLNPSLIPDLTIIFDAPLEVAMRRVAKGRESKDRMETEHSDFFKRVQNVYHEIAKDEPKRVRMINTDQEKEATRGQIRTYVTELLNRI